MIIAEMKRIQVLAGILDQYEDYIPDTSNITLTEEESAAFDREWALIEESLLNEIDFKDPKVIKIGQLIVKAFKELSKKFLQLVKAVGKISQWFTNTVIGVARWMWRNKWGVAIVAGLGVQYKWIITGLDAIYNALPERVLGWIGADVPFGQLFSSWSEEGLRSNWESAIEWLRSFETTSLADLPRDVLTEMAAGLMDIIGKASGPLIDLTIECWQALGVFGFDNVGIVVSWMFMIGIIMNCKDWIYKKGAPLLKYIMSFFTKANVEQDLSKTIQNDPALQDKSNQFSDKLKGITNKDPNEPIDGEYTDITDPKEQT